MIKDQNDNIISNITNDVPVVGTDLFADSEDLLNELTDSDLGQIVGGGFIIDVLRDANNDFPQSHLSLLACL